ncbi:MAG: ABC transporter permease [Brevibacterium aurantiacum]|uniref:Autoinducer 2 import system permease protein LsrD n=1 Tax=Brevibacterium aurantiacum TaxID=273384 RepID=A0A2H1K593_BREAU|nr:ABC transporter permease [Brevibacterium aurantiacum]MDN5585982.1 ABC transporter permease [Brevibacterium sp.]AZL07850.1 ABC transporter permease [Brevibacterium aurantiacum]PCC43734.1 ABC transporter permease [Brevibacterium aurantiacum]RCS94336.1 ABC transporter permease [Brevibacterium aurantiacum]SMX94708.1 ribose transport system permease protein [Brevibacterium aurantiacum]
MSSRLRRLDTTALVYLALIVVLIISAILVATTGRSFFSAGNIRDILTGMSVLGFVAIGQTLVILGASLDLSVPYVMSLASLIAAQTMNGQDSMVVPAVLLTLAVAACIGAANGLIVTVLRVHGFVATLGVGLILKGYLNTSYQGTEGEVPWSFQLFGATGIGPVPISTIVMLALAALVSFILVRTAFGHHLFAAGGNAEVARLSGVRARLPLIGAHMGSSVCAAIAGLLLASRLGVGSPTVGSQGSYDLLSIAAVVLGGTVLMGGRGSIWGTIGGVAIFAVLDNLMSVMQFNPFLKDVIRGLVIIIAVALYARRRVIARRVRFAGSTTGPNIATGFEPTGQESDTAEPVGRSEHERSRG